MKPHEYLFKLIKSRRSIRKFKRRRVPLKAIIDALNCGLWAPSAHNAQPWRFILIVDDRVKKKLAEAMGREYLADLRRDGVHNAEEIVSKSIDFFSSAPALILACLSMENMDKYPDEKRSRAEYLMGVQSVAASIQNVLLALHGMGLGACWFCAPLFCQEAVRKALGIPKDVDPQALIAVGEPDESPSTPPRLPLSEVAYLNYWGERIDNCFGRRSGSSQALEGND